MNWSAHMESGSAAQLSCDRCAIRHRAVCAALSREELAALNAISSRKRLRAGETIMWAQEPVDYFANLIEGVVKLSKSLADGREQIVGLMFPGDFLGRPYTREQPFNVEAVTDVRLCRFPQGAFEKLAHDHTGLGERLFNDTLDELDRARDWLLLLGRKNAQERLATFLHMLGKRSQEIGCHDRQTPQLVAFDLPLSRSQIAAYLGLTIETVSRQLSRLRRAGVIDIVESRHIVVPRIRALEALCGE